MITKSELIEYLKHTPENTNYNILYSSLYNGSNKEAVDEFIEALSRRNLSLAALQPYLAKLYEDDKTISPDPLPPFSSGSGSIPKPLTYDYMPEGYPSKTVQTTVLMEEQECAFTDDGKSAKYYLTDPFDLVEGQTYTVKWDGTEYECVCGNKSGVLFVGNLSYANMGENSGEPFLYDTYDNVFTTFDTAASHTISVTTTEEIVIPMAEAFLPETLATKSDVEVAQTAANAAQTAAKDAQFAAKAALNTAKNALPLSGGEIRISSGGQFATLTLNEFTGSTGVQKRGICIGGSGAYGTPILEVTHDDITIYDNLSQRRIGGLNSTELFLKSKNSNKTFKITVDDSGTLSATEVT